MKFLTLMLVATLVVASACGKKGNPIRPGAETKTEKPADG